MLCSMRKDHVLGHKKLGSKLVRFNFYDVITGSRFLIAVCPCRTFVHVHSSWLMHVKMSDLVSNSEALAVGRIGYVDNNGVTFVVADQNSGRVTIQTLLYDLNAQMSRDAEYVRFSVAVFVELFS